MNLPTAVTIVEVGPRDGLQNESRVLGIEQRRELIERLIATGVPRIEIGSFVNPKVIPAMAGTAELVGMLPRSDRTQYTALVPNVRGYEAAAEAGLGHARLVVAASDEMNRRNFRASPAETMQQHAEVARLAARDGIAIGGIIGTAFGCPYEGAVDPQAVVALAQQFADHGADEIVLADTTGMATPRQVIEVCGLVANAVPNVAIGAHFHNTRNTGYANALAALQAGVTILDASVGGIGGCPFAPRAVGNIATEDLIHMLNGMKIRSGVDLACVIDTANWLAQQLDKDVPALVGKADPVFMAV